jgi:hypothetical protein
MTDAARALDLSRKTLSMLLNDRSGISPEMAVRFGTSSERLDEPANTARSLACREAAQQSASLTDRGMKPCLAITVLLTLAA